MHPSFQVGTHNLKAISIIFERTILNGKGRYPVTNMIEKSTTTTEELTTSTFNPKWAETTYSVQTEATTPLTDFFTSTETGK